MLRICTNGTSRYRTRSLEMSCEINPAAQSNTQVAHKCHFNDCHLMNVAAMHGLYMTNCPIMSLHSIDLK